jgi:hypothetical protein
MSTDDTDARHIDHCARYPPDGADARWVNVGAAIGPGSVLLSELILE